MEKFFNFLKKSELKDENNPNGEEKDKAISLGKTDKNDYTIRERLRRCNKKFSGFTAVKVGDEIITNQIDIATDNPNEFMKAIIRMEKNLVLKLISLFGEKDFIVASHLVDFEDKLTWEQAQKISHKIKIDTGLY